MARRWTRFLYPRLSLANFGRLLLSCLLGALAAGSYGVLHDQVTYTLSPEYFTHFKFLQFSDADFGLPDRAFVGLIGFLATWWVGAIAGWILGRVSLKADGFHLPFSHIVRSFAFLLVATFCGGLAGAIFNELTFQRFFPLWEVFRSTHGVEDLKAFARVGQIHNFGYLGAIVGLMVVTWGLRRQLRTLSRSDVDYATLD